MDQPKPNQQSLFKQGQQALQKLEQIQNNPNWQQFSDKPCIMKKMAIQNRLSSRGQAIVNFSMDKIYQFLGQQQALFKLNPQLKEVKILYEIKDKFRINYMNYHGVWPVANRDFVNVAMKVNNGEKCYIAARSCDYAYPEQKGIVRAILFIGGYILEKINEVSTRVTYISDADFKGYIPSMITKQLSKLQGSIASKVQGQMKKL